MPAVSKIIVIIVQLSEFVEFVITCGIFNLRYDRNVIHFRRLTQVPFSLRSFETCPYVFAEIAVVVMRACAGSHDGLQINIEIKHDRVPSPSLDCGFYAIGRSLGDLDGAGPKIIASFG